MARSLRIDITDGWYHVVVRGSERRAIFTEDVERKHFLELLSEAVDRYGVQIHGYVLMDNHYHLLVRTPQANLSQMMQWVNVSYSVWFNRRHDRVGPLLQGRFKSIPIEDGGYVLSILLYIHLNPVRVAGLGLDKRSVKAENHGLKRPDPALVDRRVKLMRQFCWSSHRIYGGLGAALPWLSIAELRRRAGGKERYRTRVRQMITRGVDVNENEKLRESLVLGSREFMEKLRGMVGGPDREQAGKREFARRYSFADVIRAVEAATGESWTDVRNRHGHPARALVISIARRSCGMTLRQIGEELGGIDYAAVCMMDRRFQERLTRERAIRKLHKSAKDAL